MERTVKAKRGFTVIRAEEDKEMSEIIQELIEGNDAIIFSIEDDPYCVHAKAVLYSREINFKIIEMDKFPNGDKMREALEEVSGQKCLPVVYINRKKHQMFKNLY